MHHLTGRNSEARSAGPGRLLPYVPLQTSRWGDIAASSIPMAEVDPNRTAPIGSLLAPEINYSGIQTGVADSHLLSLSWRKPVPSGRIANSWP